MSRRVTWIDVTGLMLGAAVMAATVYSGVRIFRGGPAGGPLAPRLVETFRAISEGFSRNIRAVRPDIPWAGGWETAEGEEIVKGEQTVLAVTNVSGPIRVIPWDQEGIRVRYVKQARTQADLKDFVIEAKGDGDTVNVRPVYAALGALGRLGSVELEISVPPRIRSLSLRNDSGDIEVKGLTGVVAKELVTVSGAIHTDGPGNLSARSTSGAVDVAFHGDRLELSTVSGRISATLDGLGKDGADLGSVSGSVDLAVVGLLDAAVELRSLSGSVVCDYPVTTTERARGKLKGSAGAGGPDLKIHTTSGSIRVTRR